MSSETMYTLEEDKQEIKRQLGCMNGILQLFDRRFLLGQRRHGNRHNKLLPQGQSVIGNKFNNASYKHKDQAPNKIMKQKHRESVESSRNSFSSCCSCLDCSKRVQTEPSSFCPSIVYEAASPISNSIRDVVKDSMTRKPRAVPVKTVAKDGRKGPTMTHVDSPRPSQQHPKLATYERRDQNLVKETSRFSYDDRESPYKLQSYNKKFKHNEKVIDQSPTREPESNRPSTSSVVARLMGLDVLNCEALKIKPCLDDEMMLVSNALTRNPLEPPPWKQEAEKRVNMKVKQQSDHACQSVYGHIEKKFTEVRALKLHTLEAMHKTKMKLENTQPQKVKKVNPGRGNGRNLTPIGTKATSRTNKQVSPSHITDCLSGVSPRPSPSPKRQRSKIRKQSNGLLIVSRSKTRDQSCMGTRHIRNLSVQSDTVSIPSESDSSVASQSGPDVDCKDRTLETKKKFAEMLIGYKPMVEQPSPVSVLDVFCTEDAPSPVKKKSYAIKDDEDSCFDEQERSQVDDLISSTEQYQLTFGSNDIKFENIKQHVHQIESLNSASDETTINPHEGTNEDHIYIKEILSASGFLKNLNFATAIVHLHLTDSLINPELFNILEKPKENTSICEKIKRKLIFDTVNNILVQKLSRTPCPGQWTSKNKGKILDAQNILEELCLEINDLRDNKKSEDWHDYCNEVPALVFDIERFVFEDLITETMNATIFGQQYGHRLNNTTD